jgi:hypothetical protein
VLDLVNVRAAIPVELTADEAAGAVRATREGGG